MIEFRPFRLTYEIARRGPRDRRETYYKVHVTDIHAHPWLHIEIHIERQHIGDGIDNFEIIGIRYHHARRPKRQVMGSLDAVVIDTELWTQVLEAIPHLMMYDRIWNDGEEPEDLGYTWSSWDEIRGLESPWEGTPIYTDEQYASAADALVHQIQTYLYSDPVQVDRKRMPARAESEARLDSTHASTLPPMTFDQIVEQFGRWLEAGSKDEGDEDR